MNSINAATPASALFGAVRNALLAALAILFIYQFAMNMAVESGLPYWDDWEYFFSPVKGVHLPLDIGNMLAREADYTAPVVRMAGRAIWLAFGADMQVFRLFAWALFGGVLWFYYSFLRRAANGNPVADIAVLIVGFVLLSAASNEYFYFQHVAYSQPLCYFAFFMFCYFWSLRAYAPALLCFAIVGTFSIFGTSYVIACTAAIVIEAWMRRRDAAQRGDANQHESGRHESGHDGMGWSFLLALLGCGAIFAFVYATLNASSANHTQFALVPPWTAAFWTFVASAFAAAFGFDPAAAGRAYVAIGGGGFLLFVGVGLGLSLRSGERGKSDWLISATLAGTVLVTFATAVGRARICGDAFAAWAACGATPRYVYPVVLALPALCVGVIMLTQGFWREGRRFSAVAAFACGTAIAAALGAGHLVDRQGQISITRWDFASLRRMMEARDEEGARCAALYLAGAPAPDADWKNPMVCPGVIGTDDAAPFLRIAVLTNSPIGQTLQRDAAILKSERRIEDALLTAARETSGTYHLSLTPAEDGRIVGYLDQQIHLKSGGVAVAGWAVDAFAKEPIAYLLLLANGEIVGFGRTGGARPDVAAALNMPVPTSGFSIPVPDAIAQSGAALQVLAIDRSLKTRMLNGTLTAIPPRPAIDAGK